MCRPAVFATTLVLGAPLPAMADGSGAQPGLFWQAWNWDPLVLLSVGVLALLYGRGVNRLWRKGGFGRTVAWWQAAAFFAALVVIVMALLSPVDALSAEMSSAHMVQHMLLM